MGRTDYKSVLIATETKDKFTQFCNKRGLKICDHMTRAVEMYMAEIEKGEQRE